MPATRPSTVRCAAISGDWSEHQHDRQRRRGEPVRRKPRSFVGRLAAAAWRSRSSTSSRRRRSAFFASRRISDTGDGGKEVIAYTAQLGNELLGQRPSAEARRNTQISKCYIGSFGVSERCRPRCPAAAASRRLATPLPTWEWYGGWQVPDLVANLRVEGAWGSAQIAGALGPRSTRPTMPTPVSATRSHPGAEINGHPER